MSIGTETKTKPSIKVTLPIPHSQQIPFIDYIVDCLKHGIGGRAIVKAGRRGGKTVGAAEVAVEAFAEGYRVLYTAPTAEQVGAFWFEIKLALADVVRTGAFKQNESENYIEQPGTERRIKAKTAWNADTLRGDYADLLIFDEWQLTNEDAWSIVGVPMLLDNNGVALFIYTPPSLRSAGVSKAKDPRHAAKMFKKAEEDTTGRWQAYHFKSHDNPHISRDALREITQDMTPAAYRQEILAEDDELELTQLVYSKFNEGLCKIKRFDIPVDWPIYSGHDFGGANPAALFFAQVKLPLPDGTPPYMRFNDLVAYREYLPGPGYSAAQHSEVFKKLICLPGEYGKDQPKTLNLVRSAGGSHQEEEVREAYSAHGWSISQPEIARVLPQVDRVIGLMTLNKVYIFNDLYSYLEELMNCLFKRNKLGVITDEIENEAQYHLCACARYILSHFTPETIVSAGPQKAVSNH